MSLLFLYEKSVCFDFYNHVGVSYSSKITLCAKSAKCVENVEQFIILSHSARNHINHVNQWFSNFLNKVPPRKTFGSPSKTIMTLKYIE